MFIYVAKISMKVSKMTILPIVTEVDTFVLMLDLYYSVGTTQHVIEEATNVTAFSFSFQFSIFFLECVVVMTHVVSSAI